MSNENVHRFMIEIEGLELDDDQVAEMESAVRTAALTSLTRLGLADDLVERPLEPSGGGLGGRQFVKR